MNKELITAEEAAEVLAVSVRTLANWRSRNYPSIEFVKIGRCVRYRRSALDTYINAHSKNVAGGVR